MEEEVNQESGGITFGELFRAVIKRFWLILAICVASTLAFTLIFRFAVAPAKTAYTLTFNLDYPNWSSLKYPDGKKFDYKDLISYDHLKAVQESDARFKDVDIQKIYEKGGISVKAKVYAVRNQTNSANSGEEYEDRTYTGDYAITIARKYFPDQKTAVAFLQKLASYPIQYVKNSVEGANYLFNLTAYDTVDTYSEKLDYLAAQKDYLLGKYDSFIGTYGENYNANGTLEKKLREYRIEVQTTFDGQTQSKLRTDLTNNGYLFNKTDKSATQIKIADLNREKEYNGKEIDALKKQLQDLVDIYGTPSDSTPSSTTAQYETFNQRIVSLTTRNIQIDKELEILQTTVGAEIPDDTAFAAELAKYRAQLETLTETYHSVNTKVYDEESRIRYDGLSEGGAMSTVYVVILTFVLVGFVTCVIVWCIDIPRERKKKRAAEEAENGKTIALKPLAEAAPADATNEEKKDK